MLFFFSEKKDNFESPAQGLQKWQVILSTLSKLYRVPAGEIQVLFKTLQTEVSTKEASKIQSN